MTIFNRNVYEILVQAGVPKKEAKKLATRTYATMVRNLFQYILLKTEKRGAHEV